MNQLCVSLFLLHLVISSVFASETILYKDSVKNLKKSLNQSFYPALLKAITEDEDLVYLTPVSEEIEKRFLADDNNVSSNVYDRICKYFHDKIVIEDLEDSIVAKNLLFHLRSICESNRLYDSMILKQVEDNRLSLETMADICHLFKMPVQWLVLSGKAYGLPNMFKDAPLMLENLRRVFLNKFDPTKRFNYQEKLDFIKNSLDFYVYQCKNDSVDNDYIYEQLKSQFMTYINSVIARLLEEQLDFQYTLSTGLGKTPIKIADELVSGTTNEDLWSFIIDKIDADRPEIERNTSNIKQVYSSCIIDAIAENLVVLRDSSTPFSLDLAHESIKSSISQYFSIISSFIKEYQPECEFVELIQDDIEKVNIILNFSLKKFNGQLSKKLKNLARHFTSVDYFGDEIDWSCVAVSQMASENFKAKNRP